MRLLEKEGCPKRVVLRVRPPASGWLAFARPMEVLAAATMMAKRLVSEAHLRARIAFARQVEALAVVAKAANLLDVEAHLLWKLSSNGSLSALTSPDDARLNGAQPPPYAGGY